MIALLDKELNNKINSVLLIHVLLNVENIQWMMVDAILVQYIRL